MMLKIPENTCGYAHLSLKKKKLKIIRIQLYYLKIKLSKINTISSYTGYTYYRLKLFYMTYQCSY